MQRTNCPLPFHPVKGTTNRPVQGSLLLAVSSVGHSPAPLTAIWLDAGDVEDEVCLTDTRPCIVGHLKLLCFPVQVVTALQQRTAVKAGNATTYHVQSHLLCQSTSWACPFLQLHFFKLAAHSHSLENKQAMWKHAVERTWMFLKNSILLEIKESKISCKFEEFQSVWYRSGRQVQLQHVPATCGLSHMNLNSKSLYRMMVTYNL